MKKKLLSYFLACIVLFSSCFLLLTGCATGQDPSATGYAFVDKIISMDYSGAYDYAYTLTSDVNSREDFVNRYTNIFDALEITNIQSSGERTIKQVSDTEYTMTYSLQMTSTLLGTVTYDYSAEIVSGPQGYTVLYMPNLILPQLDEGDKVRVASQSGARGEIFSADGVLLAANDYAQSIYIDLEKSPNIEEIKSFLQTSFGTDPEKVQSKYDNAVEKGYPTEVLATYPKGTLTEEQKNVIMQVNGLGVDEERLTPARYYPLKDNAAHIIGYLGSPDEEQLAQYADAGITENSTVGKTGLERTYEEILRGSDGKVVYIEDEKGNVKEKLYEDPKTDGSDVTLTIDSRIQNKAYTLMASNLQENESGAVIVMDYATGGVEAMVSYPSFDDNLFNFPLDATVTEYYMGENSGSPMLNRATQSTYTPGSTFKPFAAVPSIESGLLTESSSPNITREMNPSGRGATWNPRADGWDQWVYPQISTTDIGSPFVFETSMKSSDNIFFAYYALNLGIDNMKAYLEKIGIGEAPSFELPVKSSSMANKGSELTLNWLALTGFGTGELSISPLQMACMYTAFENNGDMVNPTLLKNTFKMENDEQTILQEGQRTIFKEATMSSSTIDMEKSALKRVMVDGTGANAGLGNMNVYGKTGTAQFSANNSREWNWIVAIDNDSGKLYLVIVETDTNAGTQAKLNILRGLIDDANYNASLDRGAQSQAAQPDEGE
ncbi:MAG: penicillin-binding transpeptidase domain-containing protein [Christensenella sp.]|nr:penicillin-binding transpeptidase domain-containing protein [Christensenella sp.]